MSEIELIALRERVAGLEAENYQLRCNVGVFPETALCASINDLKSVSIPTRDILTLRVAASWDVKIDPLTQQFHCVSRSGHEDDEFHYQYFMEDPRRLRRNQALLVMEELHKRLIHGLAKRWSFADSDERRIGG